jgi:hypothetical protein
VEGVLRVDEEEGGEKESEEISLSLGSEDSNEDEGSDEMRTVGNCAGGLLIDGGSCDDDHECEGDGVGE